MHNRKSRTGTRLGTRRGAVVAKAAGRDLPQEAKAPVEFVLADPQAYSAHELAQKQRLAAAYVQAAGPELARLHSDLEQGREAGVPPEELAKVAEKIRRIEQQRQAADNMRSR